MGLILAIVILCSSAWYLLSAFNQPAPLKIGTFFYLWYGAPRSDGWDASKFVDFPVCPFLGNYSSLDEPIIRRQLTLIKEAGIDFVVLSWWGPGENDSYRDFIDKAAKKVFDVAAGGDFGNLKFAIMVEPYKTDSTYNHEEIFHYIYSNFVQRYSSLYYVYRGNPLICFFNDPELTPNGRVPFESANFTVVTVGSGSMNWMYTDLARNDSLPTRVAQNREISVTPRFDDTRLSDRTSHVTMDANLTQGSYDFEWQTAIQLRKDKAVDTIMIISWNEYPERTAIEPHHDTLTNIDPYFLYNKTKDYIFQAKLAG